MQMHCTKEGLVISSDWGEAGGFQTGVCRIDLQWEKKAELEGCTRKTKAEKGSGGRG